MCSRFPQEICDRFINNLTDTVDYATCSLVHRSWTPSSQRRLFCVVTVHGDRNTGLKEFVQFVESAPHISQYIACLTLIGYLVEVWCFDADRSYVHHYEELVISLRAVLSLLECLPSLEAITFVNMSIQQGPQPPTTSLPRHHFCLKHFTFCGGGHHMSYEDLVALLTLFEQIRYFELRQISVQESAIALRLRFREETCQIKLSSICLIGLQSGLYLPILHLIRATSQHLFRINIQLDAWDDLSPLAGLIQSNDDDLQIVGVKLHIKMIRSVMSDIGSAAERLSSLELQSCKNLSRLDVYLAAGEQYQQGNFADLAAGHWWIAIFLLSLSPATLKIVQLRIQTADNAARFLEDLTCFNWPQLESAAGRFETLREIRISFSPWEAKKPGVYEEEVREYRRIICRMMPTLAEKDLFVF